MITHQSSSFIEVPDEAGYRILSRWAAIWIAVALAITLLTLLSPSLPWAVSVPKVLVLPLADWLNAATEWIVNMTQPGFRLLSWLLTQPMVGLQAILGGLPWFFLAVSATVLAWRAESWRLALFAALGSLVTVGLGYWDETMNTLALVGVSVPLSILLGFGFGVFGFALPRIRRPLGVLLDLMQTVPAFAYLIPILLLFGFGPVVGLIASAIYAAPPMVRNTMLGLDRVPEAQIESGEMAGCTPRQLFWQVRVPGAMPQILVGANQTTMQALSMVIIAAIIGGFDDIGWSVLTALRKAQFGQSLLSGLVIVFLAVLIDRITWGFAQQARHRRRAAAPAMVWQRSGVRIATLLGMALVLGLLVPGLNRAPALGLASLAEPLNLWLTDFLAAYGPALAQFKTAVFYYLLMPTRGGLATTVTPFTWGFALSPALITGYWLGVVVLAAVLARRALPLGGLVLFMGWISAYGMTGVPWPALSLFVTVLGVWLGGARMGLLAAASCLYLIVTGLWPHAMLSLYLCGVAVGVSLVAGGVIGGIAAHSRRVSVVVRVLADTLQTMPQFVLLIPFLMVFQVGEFTALLAIIIYAIVPAMRYVEQGLRSVDASVIEAAEQMGCTRGQILTRVRIPLALPVLALGINQTIMFALAMLSIAALVGTQDLGQQVYVALSQANAGQGALAGLAIAVIALLSDRLIHAWIARISARRHVVAPGADDVQPPV